MNKKYLQWLSAGQNGIFNLDIPILTFGQGNPKIVITSSVHGDEPIGIVLMIKLVEYLQHQNLSGTVSLIISANPSAQFVKQRVSPQDFKDLNRVGKGNPKGNYTDRLGYKLFNYFKEYDFVVNMHEFEMHTPITAFYQKTDNIRVNDRILNAIRAFSPEIVWITRQKNDWDMQYKNTLDYVLSSEGIPSFIIETVQLPFIKKDEIDSVVKGLISIIEYMGILPSKGNNRKLLSMFYRNEYTSDIAGYWEPLENHLLKAVKKGDLIGEIKTFPYFERVPIYSTISGILLQVRHRALGNTGMSLFSIGQKG